MVGLWFMVFNATFNSILAILWQSVLLVEETGVPRENHRPATSHWQTCHIMLYRLIDWLMFNVQWAIFQLYSGRVLYRAHLAWAGFTLTILVVIGTDWIGSYKSNYPTITTTTTHVYYLFCSWFICFCGSKYKSANM